MKRLTKILCLGIGISAVLPARGDAGRLREELEAGSVERLSWAFFEALSFASSSGHPRAEYERAGAVARVWAIRDRDSLIGWFSEETAPSHQYAPWLLLDALWRTAFDDVETIRDTAAKLKGDYRVSFLYSALDARFRFDLPSDLAPLMELAFSDRNLGYFYAGQAAISDWKLALNMLETSDLEDTEKSQVYGRLLSSWLADDPEGLKRALPELAPSRVCGQKAFFREWAEAMPAEATAAAADLLLKHPVACFDGGDSPLETALGVWLEEDREAVLAWFEAQTNASLIEATERTIVRLSVESDGVLAARFFERIEDPVERSKLAKSLARTLADRDPATGIEWLRRTSEEMNVENATETFFSWLSKYDLAFAIENYPDDLPAHLQSAAVKGIMDYGHQADPDTLLGWMEKLPPITTRDYTLSWWFKNYVVMDAERVAEFVDRHPESGTHHRPYYWIGIEWAKGDPAAAKAWAEGVEKGGPRYGSAYGVAAGLLAVSDAETLGWIDSLPSGHRRDSAALAYIDERMAQRPDEAFRVAAMMSDRKPERRMEMMVKSLKRAEEVDASDIEGLLRLPGLTDGDRAELRKVLSTR